MSDAFQKGDRVVLSPYGKETFSRRAADRVGTVISTGTRLLPECVGVVWDGTKTRTQFHRDFLSILREKPTDA